MRRLRSRRWVAGGLALQLLSLLACHAYRPVEPATLRSGQSVRVRLADAAARARAGWTAAASDALVGHVVRRSADSLVLSVAPRGMPAGAFSPFRDTVAVPAGLVTRVEKEGLSPWRTGLLVVGVVGGTFLLLELNAGEGGGGNPPSPPNGDPPESLAPRP